MGAEDVNKIVSYLRPTTMSSDAFNLQQELMKDTQELAGAGDNVNGNIDPTQASGKAILAVQQAGQQPLNEQIEKFKTFLEDLARVWFEMLQTYSINGIVATREQKDEETGEIIEVPYQMSYEELQELKLNIKIEITRKSSYDTYALEQTLENLLMNQIITFEEYVEALPEGSAMPKHILERLMKKRKENQEKLTQMQIQADQMNSAMSQAMQMQSDNSNLVEQIAQQGEMISGGGQNGMPPM